MTFTELYEKLRALIVEAVVLNRADDRLPLPCDERAERRVVAAEIRGFRRPAWCKAEHFHHPFHKAVIATIDAMHSEGSFPKAGDPSVIGKISDRLYSAGLAGPIEQAIADLLEENRVPSMLSKDAQTVVEKWRIRRLLEKMSSVDALGRSGQDSEFWEGYRELSAMVPPVRKVSNG